MSLCWQNLDPGEDRSSTDTFGYHTNLPDGGEQSEAKRVIARLRGWCENVFPGVSARISAGTELARIRAATK